MKYILKESNLRKEINKIIELIESRLNYNLYDISDQYEWEGQGAYANVYSIKGIDDKIIRIESNYSSHWEKLIGKKFDNVVEVYYEKDIDMDNFGCHLVIMEQLDPLEDDEYNALLYLCEEYNDGLFFEEARKFGNATGVVDEDDVAIVESVEYIINDVIAGMDQLESIGVRHHDIYQDNIMYDSKTREYKLIDIG